MKIRAALTALLFMSGTAFAADNNLDWDNVEGEDGFNIYAKNASCSDTSAPWPSTPIASTGPDVLTFVHTVADSGFNWCYRLTAFNANGESGFSNEAGKVPDAPGNLRVTGQ